MNKIETPWGETGYITYKRTYARRLKDIGEETEEFKDTVERVIRACDKQLKVGFSSEEENRLREILLSLKGIVAGRFLWQLGTKTVDSLGLASLQNCATTLVNEPVRPFTWAMDMLMLGSGVGYNIQREYVYELPKAKRVKIVRQDTKDADFIVPDTRAGWVELLERTLQAHFYTGKGFTYSTVCIRGKGTPIKGFGGIASGPEELCWGIENISKVINNRGGKKLRPIDCLDIMNIIGFIVVAGNVRRSAQIAIGDMDDLQYLNAKRWDLGNIPNWRAMSNNSIVCNDINLLPEQFWQGYNGNGEPYGMINLNLARSMGRIGETQYPDPDVIGFNPCAEQSLADKETCCLAEIYLPNISSKEELFEVAKYLYRINKHSLSLPCHHPETEAVVHKNMRMGIGITGYLQSSPEQREWLSGVYSQLREFDKEYSAKHNWPTSVKLTTVKPSGCSVGNSLIFTEQGILRLDEMVNTTGSEWQDINYSTTDGHKISKGFINGFVPTKKITTADGFVFESSLNHKYLVNDGEWKTVNDLTVSDKFRVQLGTYNKKTESNFSFISESHVTNTNQIIQPEKMNSDLAFFFGLLAADGSTHSKGIRISFNRRDNDLIVLLKDIIKNNFGLEGTIDEDHGFYVNSVQLLRWLEKNELSKNYCDQLSVPKVIRTSSVDSIKSYIAGFWRGDGGQHNISSWSLCSVSHPFIQEIATLCRAVGYNPSIKSAGPGGYGKLDRKIILNRDSKPNPYQSNDFKNRFSDNNIWLDPIVSIEESHNHTYDVSVDHEDHKYLLAGAESHNTLSLLAGVTPGVHPGYSQYFIRRIRMASNSNLVNLCRENGYHVEYQRNFDGSEDKNTVVVSFPCKYPDGTVVAKDVTAIDQMNFVKELQTKWSDNAVSCTVYYKKEELSAIKEWLKNNYNNNVKTVSFLLHNDHGFDQAPYEEITKEKYEELVAKTKPITAVEVKESDLLDSAECLTGACPVK